MKQSHEGIFFIAILDSFCRPPIAIVFYAGYKAKEHIVKGRLDTIIEATKDQPFPFEHLVYVGDFMK